MDYKHILVIYKSHKWESVKENKLKRHHIDNRHVAMLLVPLYGKDNIYMIVKPSHLFLAKRFVAHYSNQAATLLYDMREIYKLATLEDTIDTSSLIEFCNFMSIIYKTNGVANTMEGVVEDASTLELFYPESYQLKFYDKNKQLIGDITCDSYDDGSFVDSWDFEMFYDVILAKKTEPLKSLFLDMNPNSNPDWLMNIESTGNSVALNLDGTWRNLKKDFIKTRKLKSNEICMDYLYGFGCFFVCGATFPKKVYEHLPIDIHFFVIDNEDLMRYQQTSIHDLNFLYDIIERNDLGVYSFGVQTQIADYFNFICWLAFIDEIIGYTMALMRLCANYQDEDQEEKPNIVGVIQSSALKRIFAVTDKVNVNIKNAFYAYLKERI